MRISNSGIPTTDPRPLESAAPKPAASPASGDVVTLSSRSVAGAEGEPQARIETLRNRIESGEYAVDYEALAERLVDDELLRTMEEG